jgi:uncharacterized protein YyaL (SSP411 family)
MLRLIYQSFIPNKVVAFRPAKEQEAKEITELIPFLKQQAPLEGKTTAYVCKNYTCELPATNIKKLREILLKDE